jgi:hypothetical protein
MTFNVAAINAQTYIGEFGGALQMEAVVTRAKGCQRAGPRSLLPEEQMHAAYN